MTSPRPAGQDQSSAVATTSEASDSMALAQGRAEICKRRRLLWRLFFLYLPVAMLGKLLLGGAAVPYVAFSWIGLIAFAAMRVGWSKCPRCGECFHMAALGHNPWTRKCLHCGLPLKGEEPSTAKA